MENIKCFYKLHTHVIPENFANMKTECVKNQSTLMRFNSFRWNKIYKCVGETIHKVSQHFLQECRITLHRTLHNTLALESQKQSLKGFL